MLALYWVFITFSSEEELYLTAQQKKDDLMMREMDLSLISSRNNLMNTITLTLPLFL
jgi:hypothetical protein